jgi:hypothetical protein
MKFFARLSFSICGMDTGVIIDAPSEVAAEELAYEMTVEHATSYGFYQDEEVFGDFDTLGCDFDEETESYAQEGFIDSHVELYIPELHDMHLSP